ncbi:uncharacterized protein PAC_17544 [Phialocephala subalpina]|uniref:Uncharacterized protein n=1 Tax=Phialocephala subalpina TaxID=576137 RepID=A0A1L7XRL3_9HELO|nr:uncharacterized protein PAC_17544 [Phialocephala subalpina]
MIAISGLSQFSGQNSKFPNVEKVALSDGYAKLEADGNHGPKDLNLEMPKNRIPWPMVSILVIAWAYTIITVYTFSFQQGRRCYSSVETGTPTTDSYNCSNSSVEARRKGCVFDITNRGWFPPACYDKELTAEEGIQMIERESYEAGEGPNPLLVTQELHLWHCAFQWRKYHRAVERERLIDSYMSDYNDTRHCSKILDCTRSTKERL